MNKARKPSFPIERALPGVHRHALQLLVEHLEPGCQIIDMGTGQGALAARLSAEGFSVTAIDVNAADFQLVGDIEYLTCDFNDVTQLRSLSSRRNGLYDAAISIEVIEHLENPWEYVRNLKSLVRPGGLVLISTPNPASWHSRLTFLRRGEFDDFGSRGQEGHVNPIAPWEMHRIVQESGLTITGVTYAGDVYQDPSLLQRTIRVLSYPLRALQTGALDGFCQVFLTRRP